MKIKTLLLAVLLGILCGVVLPRQAEARVTFSYFYESLAPYGDWVDVDQYGYCWQPRGVDANWRPYTDGYWSYTDAGWTWVSYEDFGSITYHYGRWVRLEDFGWVWRPDYQWGPAWVSWRQSDDYVGWAPLPPDAAFDPDTGIGVWADRDYDIGPSAYIFCETRYFGAPVLRNFVVPWRRNVAIINSTVNITNITFITASDHSRIVYNGGLDFRRIASRGDYRIEALHLQRQTDGDWARHPHSELSRRVGDQLIINAPEIEAPKTRFAPAVVVRAIRAPQIDKGWSGVSDPQERERFKARVSEQTQGLTRATAPAKPVEAAHFQKLIREIQAQPPKPASSQPQPQVEPQRQVATPAATPQEQRSRIQREAQPQVEPQRQVATPAATPQEQRSHVRREAQPQAEPQRQAAQPSRERSPQVQPSGSQSPTPGEDRKKKNRDHE